MDQLLMLALLYNASELELDVSLFCCYYILALLSTDLVLYNLKVPVTENFLRDIKKLKITIYQRKTHQAIEDKTWPEKVWWKSTI